MALAAASEALEQAGWRPQRQQEKDDTVSWPSNFDSVANIFTALLYSLDRLVSTVSQAVIIGSSVGSLRDWQSHSTTLHLQSFRGFSPLFLPRTLPNIPAFHVASEFGFRGQISAPATACTTGTVALGEAFRLIRHGYSKVVVAGGADATVTPLALAGFGKLRALPRFSNPTKDGDPREMCRPFDANRTGLLVGEGAGILVLEDFAHARARGATILGEIVGFGSTSDAFHAVRPDPSASAARLSIQRAMEDATKTPGCPTAASEVAARIGYLNAHATATALGDPAELLAIQTAFSSSSDDGEPLYVSSLKASIGHGMGAAGALETAITLCSLLHSTLPPTLNLKNPIRNPVEGGRQIEHVTKPIPTETKWAVKNSFGFGGGNATLVLRVPED